MAESTKSIISFDEILGAFSASFVGSDRPSFRIRRVRPQCSSPENLVSSSPAICKRLQTFESASTSLKTRGGRLPRRCFLAWCTQFQITHVFLEAVPALRPSNFFKTCESLNVAREAFTKTHRHRAFDASSFSRLKSPPQTHKPASATRIGVFRRRTAAGLFLARLTRSTPAGREKTARRPSGARPARRCSPTSRAPGACATPRRSSNWSNARAGAVPRVGRAAVPALTRRLAETSTLGRWRRPDHDAAVTPSS